MAAGMKYPKQDLPSSVEIKIGDHQLKISDALSHLSITPYFGFWGVDEVWKMHLGGAADLAYVMTLESYPTRELAQAYMEGFLAGRVKRKEPGCKPKT